MLNVLITRLSASQPCKRRTLLGFLLPIASPIAKSFASLVERSESNQAEGNESFTVSYLMKSCGLSANVAIDVSKRVKLKDPDKPDSVLSLLRRYEFSETQISKLVKKHPYVLLANPENTLLPKLRFLQSIGFLCSELAELIVRSPLFLKWSLEERVIPLYEALKSALNDDEKLYIALRRLRWYFLQHGVMNLAPNIKFLREHGIPQSSITKLLTNYTSLAFMKHAKLVEHVKFAKETGMEPFKPTFILAIHVSATTKKSTWKSKLEIFERCGWSRDVTLSVFRKFPICMYLSEDKIRSTMKFLVDEMHMTLEEIAKYPAVLGYSLKQRIIPRCSVVKILKMEGLINYDNSLYYYLMMSEKMFLEKFVIRLQVSVPQLLNIYKVLVLTEDCEVKSERPEQLGYVFLQLLCAQFLLFVVAFVLVQDKD
ncbi:transcription termination factor MTERF15, mitochondrial-like [Senna tora]|uniref:Transcription termination factor MTERF15, mitochondrial-like n=1 Tax=Senna tora TaxID=362788 RepID=A0A834T557_9FABA|nr:transcription termination factor MTERF15, mitochondrial-like [Senna tora]